MKITSGGHEFEVVEKMPKNYVIWNIGDNMVDGYLPICLCNGFNVIVSSLKAIKIDDVEELKLLRDCAGYGIGNLKACNRAIKLREPKGYIAIRKRELAKEAINIFKKIAE